MTIRQRLVSTFIGMRRLMNYAYQHKFGTFMVVVIVWLGFGSEHSLWDIWQLQREKNRLQNEITNYKRHIHEFEQSINEVSGDPDAMEHFAREKMNMKRENEDVYIIED